MPLKANEEMKKLYFQKIGCNTPSMKLDARPIGMHWCLPRFKIKIKNHDFAILTFLSVTIFFISHV